MAQRLKRLPAVWETRVRSLGWEDPLEKEIATHSSVLAWRISWRVEPGRLQSTGSQSRTQLRDFTPHRLMEVFCAFLRSVSLSVMFGRLGMLNIFFDLWGLYWAVTLCKSRKICRVISMLFTYAKLLMFWLILKKYKEKKVIYFDLSRLYSFSHFQPIHKPIPYA